MTAERPAWISASIEKVEKELAERHGAPVRERLRRGLRQVSSLWREEDGDASVFEAFVEKHLAADEAALDETFRRMEFAHETLDGHMLEIVRDFRRQTDLDLGPILPVDEILSGYDPSAHVVPDFFENKLAFAVLLDFPLTTLQERLAEGKSWSRRRWAEARLADRYARRVPAEVQQAIAAASAEADRYISTYNLWMHHLLDEEGRRLFPRKLRLISHWNLRDQLKADYRAENGLAKQRAIAKAMERIVAQAIPGVVVDNPHVDWNPFSNEVAPAASKDADGEPPAGLRVAADREPDTRYERLLGIFRAQRNADPYCPTAPTLIARRFDEDREIPEQRVEAMLRAVLASPLVAQVATLVRERVGRPLEPFDVWYDGFKPRGTHTEAELDRITKARYPTPEAFAADIPSLLGKLGFSEARARWLADRIVVDPARGAGHAFGAERRGDKSHLRTRVGTDGMDYKGFNIAVHELGHNVEQTFSLHEIDSNLLEGVPNTAFTEALAFVFQKKDLELLGVARPDETAKAFAALHDFWGTYEISGVALVDMRVWRWMYAHPDATAAELREATIAIAKEVWNEFYAPHFAVRDATLLAIYSHMIDATLYLPDYPIGHMIAHQIEERMERAGTIGPEFERMTVQGRLTPDLWMEGATGAPVGPEALLGATKRALDRISRR